MTTLNLGVFVDFDDFSEVWGPLGFNETETQQYWALLDQLESGELLIHIPEWLAEEKLGYHDGATPTTFVGRIKEESDQAIRFVDSADAYPLSQLADRIQSLETSIARLENEEDVDQERLEWLQSRLDEKRRAFEEREEASTLTEEWLPKSQIEFIGRCAPASHQNQ